MKIDDVKKFQAECGMSIELANNMNLPILRATLQKAMQLSADYEDLIRRVDSAKTQP